MQKSMGTWSHGEGRGTRTAKQAHTSGLGSLPACSVTSHWPSKSHGQQSTLQGMPQKADIQKMRTKNQRSVYPG